MIAVHDFDKNESVVSICMVDEIPTFSEEFIHTCDQALVFRFSHLCFLDVG